MNCWHCDALLPAVKNADGRTMWILCRDCGSMNTVDMSPTACPVHNCCDCPWGDWQRDYPGAETGRCLELGIVTVARDGGCTGRGRTT